MIKLQPALADKIAITNKREVTRLGGKERSRRISGT